jgi:hypothetical protein
MHEHPQIQAGMTLAELPDDETGKGQDKDDGDGLQKRRIEPIEIVAHVEQRLQAQQQDGEQDKSHRIEPSIVPTEPASVQQRTQHADDDHREHEI